MKKTILLLIAFSSFAHAGAWLSSKDKGEVILQYRHQDRPQDDLNEMALYSQYGLFEKATVGLLVDRSLNDSPNMIGQTESQGVFIRPLLGKSEKAVTSVQLMVGSATRGNKDHTETKRFYEIRLQQGFSGQISVPYFVDLQLAQKEYSEDFDAETKFDATIGFKFSQGREVYLQNFNTWSKTYRAHEIQALYSTPFRENSTHRVYGGLSQPWGSSGIENGLIFVLGYRYDF